MKLSRIINISRPPFWIIAPLLYLVQFIYFRIEFGLINAVQMLSLSFPYCFLLFGVNDLFDYKTDRINPRKGGIHGAILKKKEFREVIILSIIFSALILIVSALTLNAYNILLTIILLILSLYYSAPPRLKEIPPLDSISNGLIIFIIVLIGYSFSGKSFVHPLIIGYPYILATIAIHAYTTIIDYTPDKKAGQKTFSTLFGKRNAAIFSFIIMLFSLMMIDTGNLIIWSFLIIVTLCFLITIFYPEEKLAKNLTILIFLLFLVSATAFLFTESSFSIPEIINNLY